MGIAVDNRVYGIDTRIGEMAAIGYKTGRKIWRIACCGTVREAEIDPSRQTVLFASRKVVGILSAKTGAPVLTIIPLEEFGHKPGEERKQATKTTSRAATSPAITQRREETITAETRTTTRKETTILSTKITTTATKPRTETGTTIVEKTETPTQSWPQPLLLVGVLAVAAISVAVAAIIAKKRKTESTRF